VIDVQEPWVSDVSKDFPDFKRNLSKLIQLFRSQGGKIVHIRADYSNQKWTKEFRKLNPAKPTHVKLDAPEFASDIAGEYVCKKGFFHGFHKTDLAEKLKAMEVDTVFCAGLITSVCVFHTASGAFAEGYPVYLVHDCCGDRSHRRHEATLEVYCNYMFRPITVEELETRNTGQSMNQ